MTKKRLIIVAVLFVASFLRFYNLMWGNGYFFHPDEGNMARSVAQMTWEDNLHPDFFAYGQFPLYTAYALSIVTQSIWAILAFQSGAAISAITQFTQPSVAPVSFPSAVLWLRVISASSGILLIWLIYKITQELLISQTSSRENHVYGISLIAALLGSFTPGLIQAAHFGTTESILTMCYAAILFLSFRIARFRKNGHLRKAKHTIILCGIILGIGIASKITALYFALAPFLALILPGKQARTFSRKRIVLTMTGILYFGVLMTVAATVFALTSPYHILTHRNFISTSTYETEVATGDVAVFYTRQFIDTLPILFQSLHIGPYALGMPLFLIGSVGAVFGFFMIFSRKSSSLLRLHLIVLIGSAAVFVIGNSFLFVKWTRFLTPVFSVWAIMTAFLLFFLQREFYKIPFLGKYIRLLWRAIVILTLVLMITPGIRFFTIYTRPDSRTQASAWIFENIPDGSYVLSETANVVDIPFPIVYARDVSKLVSVHVTGMDLPTLTPYAPRRYTTISFNFYELDDLPSRQSDLLTHLERADYIYVPSRRIFANHMRLHDRFPAANRYYQALFSGRLGFESIAIISTNGLQSTKAPSTSQENQRTPQGILEHPQISPSDIFIEDEAAEESWTVFDHPVIRIFKKTTHYTKDEYGKILDIL